MQDSKNLEPMQKEESSNMSRLDSLLRAILGVTILVLMYLGYIGPVGWFGAVSLMMGLVSWCPLYFILGVSTCSKKNEDS